MKLMNKTHRGADCDNDADSKVPARRVLAATGFVGLLGVSVFQLSGQVHAQHANAHTGHSQYAG